jgi:hypothetical protein
LYPRFTPCRAEAGKSLGCHMGQAVVVPVVAFAVTDRDGGSLAPRLVRTIRGPVEGVAGDGTARSAVADSAVSAASAWCAFLACGTTERLAAPWLYV